MTGEALTPLESFLFIFKRTQETGRLCIHIFTFNVTFVFLAFNASVNLHKVQHCDSKKNRRTFLNEEKVAEFGHPCSRLNKIIGGYT